MPPRRAFLRLSGEFLGVSGLALLGGCGGRSGGTPSPSPSGREAHDLVVTNRLSESLAGHFTDAARSLVFVQLTEVLDAETLEQRVTFERRLRVAGRSTVRVADAITVDPDAAEYVLYAVLVTHGVEARQPEGVYTSRRFEPGDPFPPAGPVEVVVEKVGEIAGPSFEAAVRIRAGGGD